MFLLRTLWNYRFKIHSRHCIFLCLILGVVALAMRLFMIVASVEHAPLTADESITVLQAKRVCKGELTLLVFAQPDQFPMEAYLSAPLVHLVPRNTPGARYMSFIEGFTGLILLILLARTQLGDAVPNLVDHAVNHVSVSLFVEPIRLFIEDWIKHGETDLQC